MTPRVLVVDDSPDLRRLLARILRQAGMDVVEAASGQEALEAARSRPDLAILDVELPDLSGLEVCRRLKEDPDTAAMSVLMLSGTYRDVEDRIRGLDVDADGYLTKPVMPAELVATVRALLRRRRASATGRSSPGLAEAAVLEIGHLLSRTIDTEVVAGRIAASIRDTLLAQVAVVLQATPTGDLTVIGASGDVGTLGALGAKVPAGGITGLAARERRPVTSPNVLVDPRVELIPEVRALIAGMAPRAVLAVPIVMRNEVVGVLTVADREGRIFDEAAVRQARAFADLGGIALEGARLYAESLRGRREAEALAQVSRLLIESLDPAAVAQRIVDSVRLLFGGTFSRVRLVEPDGSLRMVAWSGRALDPVEAERRLPPGMGIAGRTVSAGKPVSTADVLSDPEVQLDQTLKAHAAGREDRAILGVPLRAARGIIGVLTLGDRAGRRFTEAEAELLQAFADQAALAFENARAYEDARRRRNEAEAAATELRLSEARLALAQRIGQVGSWEVDYASGRTTWSDETYRIYGHERGGDPLTREAAFYATVHPADRERVRAVSRRSLETGMPYHVEHRIVRPDGTERIVMQHAEIVRDATGRAVRTVGTVQDVTAQRGTEQQLATQYEVARVLAEFPDVDTAMPEILRAIGTHLGCQVAEFWALDRATHVLRRSVVWQPPGAGLDTFIAGGERLAFARGQGLLGRSWQQGRPLWVPDITADPGFLRTEVATAFGLRAALAFPVRVGDETVGVVGAMARSISEPDANILAMTTAVAHQIGQALERQRAEAALRASEALKAAIVDTALDAVITIDHAGRILEFNAAAVRAFGWQHGQAIGAPLGDLLLPPHLHEAHPEDARRLRAALLGENVGQRVELIARRADGSEIPIELAVTQIPLDGGFLFTLHIRDLTERKRLESQFLQAQKMEAVGRLAGGVAHDFNNLLTVIMGRAYVLLSRLSREDPAWRQIDLVRSTAERAAGLTHQLLAFSRKQVLQPRVLDVNAVLSGMEGMLRRLIGEDVELRIVRDPSLGRVRADPTQLEQVVLNLAVNARDAMPTGGRLSVATANVEIDAAFVASHPGARPGPHVLIAVSDTGHGMTPETLTHLFEPFFTTKEPGKGTGLGLATVYGIVKQHDGYIGVESAVGQGARFTVYLPRVPAEVTDVEEVAAPRELGGTETILVVEDENGLRDLVREILQYYGYVVLEAANAGEALLLCERHGGDIDLLLTDVVMPLMGGRELADRVVKLRPATRVIYMSGYTHDAIASQGVLEAGIRLLQKPFSPQALVQAVREVLDAPR